MAEHESARPCGCDPGCNHKCEYHERMAYEMSQTMPAEKVHAGERWVPPRIGPTRPVLPTDPSKRKEYPIFTGLLQYFPDACAEVAHVSYVGNQQHNPGQPLHWDRSKSMDQGDTLLRHLMEAGTRDSDGTRHMAKVVWRALAALQLEIEEERAHANRV